MTAARSDTVVPTSARKNPRTNPVKDLSNIHHRPTERADKVNANSNSVPNVIFFSQIRNNAHVIVKRRVI